MKTEELWSFEGRDKVADVTVPIWKIDPEVYIWGDRLFVRREVKGKKGFFYCESRGSYVIPT